MNMGEAISSAFRNYATFSGRASRSEFWWYTLFLWGIYIIGSFAAGASPPLGADLATIITVLFSLGTLIPMLAITSRRLHDVGRSGRWQLLTFVPVIGYIVLVVWWCRRGDAGDNRFGSATRRAEPLQAV